MRLLGLASVLRRAGLPVTEAAGWQSRGHGELQSVESIMCHHTATPARYAGDYPTMNTVLHGRPGLEGPLAQLGLGRSGRWYVFAAGRAYHAGVVFASWQDNWHSIGIEAEHPGGNASWPADQYESYIAGVRALRDAYDVPTDHIVGHKEAARPLGRKPDPTFNMDTFRRAVAAAPTPTQPPTGNEDEMTPQQAAQLTAVYNQTRANAGLMVSMIDNLTALITRELSDDADVRQRLEKLAAGVAAVQAELAKG